MEDDVDIYADLPSFTLNPEKNDQDCNCKELKKELSLLVGKFENIQRIKTNLENNLSSLLKTARAEIARKDKMIDDLRKRLDDVTFRRGHNSVGFSTYRLRHQSRNYENVSSMHSQDSETESHQIQFHYEYKSKKPQTDVNRIPTVFGQRLHKRIMEDEKEEKKQKALLKLDAEAKTNDISKENVVENDKENGSQFGVNNDNESNIERSNSEPPCKKDSVKRSNEENDTHRHKRIKVEDKTTIEVTDYNYLTQYDLTDNPAQYEMKDSLVKFEDRLDATHSHKKEEIPFYDGHRASSEYRDTKQDQDCTNECRSEAKSNSAKDHDSFNARNDLADSSRNSRTASRSNHVSERFNSGYKKNGHRYSPSRRSYSRSRSDYESSSSHRLRERPSRTYREKKYDDYKYDNRYKNDRLKRSYENEREENDRKTRYRRRERDDQRDKSRYSSSDPEDKESSSSYKNKKYENRRIKKESVLNDKKLPENNKAAAETNLRELSSRTIVNSTVNYSAGKNIEHKVKNESEIKSVNLAESTSVKEDLNILEEGEILDSPHKNKSAKIVKDNKIEENNVKIAPVEDKSKGSVNESIDDKSVPRQINVNSIKQLEAADISTKVIVIASNLLQENSKDCGEEKIQLNSNKSDMAVDEVHNCIKDEDKCKSHINLIDSTTQNIGIIEKVCDINDNDKNNADKKSKDSITETAVKIKETTDSSTESVTTIKEIDDSNIERATEKEEISKPNIESVVEITEVNNLNSDNNIHKIDDESRISTAKVVAKMEAVANCDIEARDESQTPIESETFHQMSNKSDVKVCLSDHNYVQNSSVSDLDAVQKPSSKSKCGEATLHAATSKKTKVEKTVDVQSVGVKRTVSSVVKNKKDQQNRGILISHRRKAVTLSDSNASMTVLMNTNVAKTSSVINNCNDNDSTLKPRACRISRVTAKATCK